MQSRIVACYMAAAMLIVLSGSSDAAVVLEGSGYPTGPRSPPVASAYAPTPSGCQGSGCKGWAITMSGNPQRANSVLLSTVKGQTYRPNLPALPYALLSISATNAGLMHPMDAPVPIVNVQGQLSITGAGATPVVLSYPLSFYWSPSNVAGAPPNNAANLTLSVAKTDIPFKMGGGDYVLKITGLARTTPGQTLVIPPPRNIGGTATWSIYIAQGESNVQAIVAATVQRTGVPTPRGL